MPTAVLTAAHVVDDAVSVRVRFDADLPGEWITEAISCWTDPRSDLAVLNVAPREGEPPVTVARCGRISDRDAVLAVQAVVGVIARHHRSDGLGRLAAARLDLALEGLDANSRAELWTLIGLPDVLPDWILRAAPGSAERADKRSSGKRVCMAGEHTVH